MPPKKKKSATNPIVVGTVSTRSTRRQSIVNIDIPKTNKVVKSPSKNSADMSKEKTYSSASENLSEKIKQTYNKMFNKIIDLPVKKSNEKPNTDSSSESKTVSKPKSNETVLQIWNDWSEDQYLDVKTEHAEATDKGNEALLQILEDWTDDESQDDKKVSMNSENANETKSDETFKTDDNFSKLKPKSSEETALGNITDDFEPSLKMQEHDDKNQEIDMETDVPKPDVTNLSKSESITDEPEVIEEYIVEENESVPIEGRIEEIVEYEGNIVECVTEEIVTDEHDQYILMETADENLATVIEHENVPFSESGFVQIKDKENEVLQNESKESEDNVAVEEMSQSVSASDSNDAEVRSFVVQDIESNKTVTEEDIPVLEHEEQVSSNVCNEDSVESTVEETEIVTKTVNTDDSVPESGKNSNTLPSRDVSGLDKIIKESENLSLTEPESVAEPMDVTEEDTEVTIESKVAQLHLMDEVAKEIDTSGDLSNMGVNSINLMCPLKEEIEEVIGVKASHTFLKGDTKDDSLSEILNEKPKTRRSRNVDKSTSKSSEEALDSKSGKATKTKDKRPARSKSKDAKQVKEPKGRKKSVERKTKEKNEKKDTTGKSDKKESPKKGTKDDQSKKPSKIDLMDVQDIRRSSRIKSINVLKKKTTGHGLVRLKSEPFLNDSDVSDSNSAQTESERSTPSASPKVSLRDKKSRWTKSNENSCDSQATTEPVTNKSDNNQLLDIAKMEVDEKSKLPVPDPVVTARLKQFVHLKENLYKTDRMSCKEAKKMTCDCFLTTEEIEANEYGCGEDCLNRLLLIECGNLCQVADRCTNKRFQKAQFAPVEVFNADKKGLGLRAAANIPYGEFILEYVGEVLNSDEFDKRAEVYSQDKNIHYYFMSLRADAIIDATMKGNISRFINHSCDPNAETQKWTVNGELRIGFFSTRTILAGEEITFDYRFQRYGKEAQKCYCEASICRGWLGERPDEDSEDEDEEEEDDEEEEEEEQEESEVPVKTETPVPEEAKTPAVEAEIKTEEALEEGVSPDVKVEKMETEVSATPVTPKRKSPRRKPRKDLFEELDPLDEEIEMLVTTGLKNQAHTLKLSRLMVRAKEPPQRTKLLRILRRGELPCRRLFLDYHGLRLMHGYMIDAQHLVHTDKKYESIRLEMLQTLAVLPIPNKSMLQDSKVLPTVEKWATDKDLGSPQDSDSNSPKNEPDTAQPSKGIPVKGMEPKKEDDKLERSIQDQEEEIRFLASKLLEGWANLKEVFRIPKKERIEQMKEHEREANKKFMQGGYGNEPDSGRKSDRYRHLSRYKVDRESSRKGSKSEEEKPSAEFIRLSKIERRKLFALQHELKEEERRLKQREMWRQHELNCLMIGTDPRFTAPFDPSRGYQYIWNPQIGQWQNYPLPSQAQMVFPPQVPTPNVSIPSMPNLSMPPPQLQAAKPAYPYPQQIPIAASVTQIPNSMGIPGQIPVSQHMQPTLQQIPSLAGAVSQLGSLQGMAGALPQSIAQIPTNLPTQPPLPQYPELVKKEEDPSQVKFMGPIPPPVKLPPKWKCAKDKYGRPYYYHVKLRKSQWEPPAFVEPMEEPDDTSESESSSDTSSLSSETSSENSDSDDEIDDTRLLIEVRKQMEKSAKLTAKSVIPDHVKTEATSTPSPDDKNSEEDAGNDESVPASFLDEEVERPSIDIRLKEQFNLLKDENPPKKKRRLGLCEEIMISPRTEEDRLQFKEDLKRYKANKEKLKRQKEFILQQTRKQLRETDSKKKMRARATVKSRIKEMPDFNSEQAKKIKESFRANMASTVVGSLNAYRKPDCKEGRITNTDDFKHLARKLTHFVMLKEMKHIEKIEDLTCTDNVKSKAREYIRKYMSKFGEMYIKRNDSPDFKD